ncbi:interferon-induced protein 44-like [Esox lucius]|uniref:TLDc domain-containing protein n=2 Tax=Esox lucius TaxID=8010 RepID=A0AAY5KZF7_ESOLU|nr:interferon-induced protein 44-like [Esox lucius]
MCNLVFFSRLPSETKEILTMNPKLTKYQEKQLCSFLGKVKLRLLYKASVHTFSGTVFHQICDNQGPTISVGYNSSGFVFGGYTSKDHDVAKNGQFIHDDNAFLFSLKLKNSVKYPVINFPNAVKIHHNCGPFFGDDFVLMYDNTAIAVSKPGSHYNFNAAEMHGNNLNLSECEVYKVEEFITLEKPWRTILWETERRAELMESIKLYKPTISSVGQARVLLIGPVGSGKSSLFNSINSIFRGHVTSQAISGSSGTSVTIQFRSYSVKDGRNGKPLSVVFCDTMGLEEGRDAGLHEDDLSSILKGHVPERYKFNPLAPLQADAQGSQQTVELQDRIHCVAYVMDTCKVSVMSTKLLEKLAAIRKSVTLLGVPQLVVLTKVDEACPWVADDLRNVYESQYIKTKAQEVSCQLGVPMSCIVPVKNYSEEVELEMNCDILLLSAVIQMLRFADNYFDDVSDQGKQD